MLNIFKRKKKVSSSGGSNNNNNKKLLLHLRLKACKFSKESKSYLERKLGLKFHQVTLALLGAIGVGVGVGVAIGTGWGILGFCLVNGVLFLICHVKNRYFESKKQQKVINQIKTDLTLPEESDEFRKYLKDLHEKIQILHELELKLITPLRMEISKLENKKEGLIRSNEEQKEQQQQQEQQQEEEDIQEQQF